MLKRLTAGWVLLFFFMSVIQLPVDAAEFPVPASAPVFEKTPVPENLGRLEKFYQGKKPGTLILIQDAHETPSAQKSIWHLLEYFQKTAEPAGVFLEGAEGPLDALFLQAFPDHELLQKTLEEYLDAAELPGSAAAAVLSPYPSRYEGAEKWPLYEEGIRLFLSALSDRESTQPDFLNLRKDLQRRKKEAYPPKLFELDQKLESFHDDGTQLLEILEILASIKPPPLNSEIESLLQIAQKKTGEQDPLDTSLRQWAEAVRSALRQQPPSARLHESSRVFETHFQQFNTSQLDPSLFAHFLQTFAAEQKLDVRVPPGASRLIRAGEHLSQLEGSQLGRDVESYASEVKQMLMSHETMRALDQETQALRLLVKLSRLELSSAEWGELRSGAERLNGELKTLWEVLAGARLFYANAEQRDQAFFERLNPELAQGRRVVLVAGGFHTESLLERAREKGYGAMLVTPQISNLPEAGLYERHMLGQVSWSGYLTSLDGVLPLYDSFQRAVRDRLLSASGERRERVLRAWEDALRRELSNQKRPEAISDYTRFLEEAESKGQSMSYLGAWEKNIRHFMEELRGLKETGNFQASAIQRLLEPAAIPSRTVLPQILVRGSALRTSVVTARRSGGGTLFESLSSLSKTGRALAASRSELRDAGEEENLEIFPDVFRNLPKTTSGFYAYAETAERHIRLRVEAYLGKDPKNTRRRILDEMLPDIRREIAAGGDVEKIANQLSLAVRTFPAPGKNGGATQKKIKAILGNIGRGVQAAKRSVLRSELRGEESPEYPAVPELDEAGRNTVWAFEESPDYLMGEGERASYYLGSYEGRPAAFGVAKTNPEAYMLQRTLLEKFLGRPDLPQLRAVIPAGSVLVFEPLPPGGKTMADAVDELNEWSPLQRAGFLRRLSETYEVLAKQGIVQRDVKPENIYLSPQILGKPDWTEADLQLHPPIVFDFELAMAFQPGTRLPAQSHRAQYELETRSGMEAVTQIYSPFADDFLATARSSSAMREGTKSFQHNPHMDFFAFGVVAAWIFGVEVSGMSTQSVIDQKVSQSSLPDDLKSLLKELLDKEIFVEDAARSWAWVNQKLQAIEEHLGSEFVEAAAVPATDEDFEVGPVRAAPTEAFGIEKRGLAGTVLIPEGEREFSNKLDPEIEAKLEAYTQTAVAMIRSVEQGEQRDFSRISKELVRLTRETWAEVDLIGQENNVRRWLEEKFNSRGHGGISTDRYFDVTSRVTNLNFRMLMMRGFEKPEGLTRIYLGGDGVNEMAFETDLDHAEIYPMNRYRFLSKEEYPLSDRLMHMINIPVEDDTGKFVERPGPMKNEGVIVKEILSKGIVYTVMRNLMTRAAAEDPTPQIPLEQRNPQFFYANLARLFSQEMTEGPMQKELAEELKKKIAHLDPSKSVEEEALTEFYSSQLTLLGERNIFAEKAKEIYEDFRAQFPGSGPYQFVDIGLQGAQQFFISSAVLYFEGEKSPLFYQRLGAHSGVPLAGYQFIDQNDSDDTGSLENYRFFHYEPQESFKANKPVFRQSPAEALIPALEFFMMSQYDIKHHETILEIGRYVRDFREKGAVMVDMDDTLTHHPLTLESEPRTRDEIVRLLLREVPVIVNTLNSSNEMLRRVFFPVLSKLQELGRPDAIHWLAGYAREPEEGVNREDGRTKMVLVTMTPEGEIKYAEMSEKANKAEVLRHFLENSGRSKFIFLDDQFVPGGYARFALEVEGGYFLDVEASTHRHSLGAFKERGAVNVLGTQKWLRFINFALDAQLKARSELRASAESSLYPPGDLRSMALRLAPDASGRLPLDETSANRIVQTDQLDSLEAGLLSAVYGLNAERQERQKLSDIRIQASLNTVDLALASAYQKLEKKFPDRRVNLALDLPSEEESSWMPELASALEDSAPWVDTVTLSSSALRGSDFHIPESLIKIFRDRGIRGFQPDPELEGAQKRLDISGQKKLGLVALAGRSDLAEGKSWVWAVEHQGDLSKLNALERAALLKLKVFLALAVALEEDLKPAELLREYGLESVFGGTTFSSSQNRIEVMVDAFHSFMLSEHAIAVSA